MSFGEADPLPPVVLSALESPGSREVAVIDEGCDCAQAFGMRCCKVVETKEVRARSSEHSTGFSRLRKH